MRYYILLLISIYVLCLGWLNSQHLVLTLDTKTYTVPDSFGYSNQGQWEKIQYYIRTSTASTQHFQWRGYGGVVHIGDRFIASLKVAQRQGKTVVFTLTGASYSFMSLTACYANKINWHGNFLMFHADETSFGVVSKRFSMIRDNLEVCVSKGILTNKDVDMIYNGYEVYTNGCKTWYKKDTRNLKVVE